MSNKSGGLIVLLGLGALILFSSKSTKAEEYTGYTGAGNVNLSSTPSEILSNMSSVQQTEKSLKAAEQYPTDYFNVSQVSTGTQIAQLTGSQIQTLNQGGVVYSDTKSLKIEPNISYQGSLGLVTAQPVKTYPTAQITGTPSYGSSGTLYAAFVPAKARV